MTHRSHLPQLDGGVFATDGGLETTMVFQEEIELPLFAAFDLLKDDAGTEVLREYFERYAAIARDHGVGLVLESPTWRASPRWARELGYTDAELDALNRKAVALMEEVRARHESERTPIVISGQVGPQDDGYDPVAFLSVEAARDYHATQIRTFADTAADMVTAITMTYVEEAHGVTLAAVDADMPVAISFTVETDGRLPSGQALGEAINEIDAATDRAPVYYMINCAHPSHFDGALSEGTDWQERVRGVRANASTKSHAELDEATELDAGDPADLAARHTALRGQLPNLNVLGGCCGTDHRHIEAILGAWTAQ